MATGDRVDASAADPAARHASAEQKMAALNELIPYVLLMPRGPERARFEESIARRLGIGLGALRGEIAMRERSARKGKGVCRRRWMRRTAAPAAAGEWRLTPVARRTPVRRRF